MTRWLTTMAVVAMACGSSAGSGSGDADAALDGSVVASPLGAQCAYHSDCRIPYWEECAVPPADLQVRLGAGSLCTMPCEPAVPATWPDGGYIDQRAYCAELGGECGSDGQCWPKE